MRISSVQLFIFPHAGGSEVSYVPIEKELLPETVASTICYAGRGRRIHEPFQQDMATMAMDCMSIVQQRRKKDMPLIFLGHSLGALIAFETMNCMRRYDMELPELVFLSGRKGPAIKEKSNRSLLSDLELLACLANMGGIPEPFLDHPDFRSFYLPIIRNDLRLNDTYCYHQQEPFDMPFVVMNGVEDENVGTEPALSWKEHTSAACYEEWLEGNHFYFSDAAAFSRTLSRYISMHFPHLHLPRFKEFI
ncbi:thioesterase II family protein [Chitinophaga ginsengisoli]|uniref:Medium-chain acyl-[acyl-carrier-protein] hydrolase n=1 Tax=Chitinophaga ginsengisoli TaxID=363837 RepID=A0A2P8FQP8_9BACT|nr:thioesterase domain-containing protein [Chitinophaga ginsengisoli]PSL24051.1 medium-chain acyl-[acyl-carrier-protein] hydrolase [Chitinophaga ginsengisoli]